MKIRFVKDWIVRQGDGQGPHYRAGDVQEFAGPVAETYARKYVSRGLAVAVEDAPPSPLSAPAAAVAVEPDPVADTAAQEIAVNDEQSAAADASTDESEGEPAARRRSRR